MTEVELAAQRQQRLAALLIGLPALLGLALITHHPIAHAAKGAVPLAGIKAVADANLAFHAVLMLLLVGQSVGLVLFGRTLGLHRPLVLAGLVFSGLAAVMLAIAMTFDGFVTHDLIAACGVSPQGCSAMAAESLRTVLAIISAFSKIGFGAQCLGFAALSGAIWVPGQRGRLAASSGVVLALAPIALMMMSADRMDPRVLLEVLAFLSAWGLCMAAVLARGTLAGRLRT